MTSRSRTTFLKRVTPLCLALACTVLSAGCAGTAATSGGGVTLAYAGQKQTDPFQIVLNSQLETQAKEQGVVLLPPTNANADPAKQIGDVSTLLARSPNALMLNPVDAKASVPAIKQANTRNVPVVSVGETPDGGDVAMVVRADNVAMGATACDEMGRRLQGRGTVLDLQGALTTANGLQRTQGFGDCMAQRYPAIKVIQKPTDWMMDKATTAAQTVLSTEQIDGIFWASDFFQPGVAKVMQGQGKWHKVGEPGHVTIVGIDGTGDALNSIRAGYQDATVAQPLDLYAKYSVFYAKAAAEGQKFAEGATDHGSQIRIEKGMPTDLLPAPLVTKDNVDEPTLWANAKTAS